MKNLACLCLCTMALSSAYADHPLPQPFKITYALSRHGINVGEMTRSLAVTGDNEYALQSLSKATGLIALFYKEQVFEETRWTYNEHAIHPLIYQYHRSGGKKIRDVTVEYDWTNGEIRNTSKDTPWRIALRPELFDNLLYQYMLMQDLNAGKRELSYQIVDGGRVKTYDIRLLGEEIIDTPLGKLHTVKLERQKPNSKRKTTLWCATALHYLAVRLEYLDKDGTVTTFLIDELSGLDAPLTNPHLETLKLPVTR
ncbi:MAG: DUF3108 domain-containing protein [Gammaproteobacteria bacterium]